MRSIKHALLGLFGIAGLTISMFGLFKVPFAESAAKDYWRQALVAILLILMLIAGTIGLFIYTFDANYFKAQIIQYVKVHKQRDLMLEGDIKVSFFPKLGLNTGKVSLNERNSTKGFASIDNARLYIAWFPLLRKQLEVDRVTLDGVHANVIRYKDGTVNLDDLLIHDGSLDSTKFDIDGVSITNSSINFQDESEGIQFALRDVNLDTGRLTDAIPSHLTANFRLQADKPHIDAKAKLNSHLFFERKTGHYEFANFDGEMEGEAAGINNLALNFEGTLNGFPATGLLTIDKLAVSAKGKLNAHALEAKLDLPQLQLNKSKLNGNKLSFSSTLTQTDESLGVAVQMPAFEFNEKILQSSETSADIELNQSDRSLQAKLSTSLNMNFASQLLQLSDITAKLTLIHPDLSSQLAAKFSGNISSDFAEEEVKISFTSKIDDSEIGGNVGLKNFTHPSYTFDIGANTLDLDKYLKADWSRVLQDDVAALNFSGLKELKLRGRLRAGEFKFAKLKTSKLVAEIAADQSTLLVEPINASLYGGSLSGSFRLSAHEVTKFTLKHKLSAIQISQLLHDTSGDTKFNGKGNIVLDLSAEGNSVGALRKTLGGTVTLALTRGSIGGINLPVALVEGKNLLGMKDAERIHSAKFTELTEFSELKTNFDINNGVARSSEFILKSPLLISKGEGEITLDKGNLEYRLNTTVSPGLKRQGIGALADMKGISVPTRVSGPYATPSFTLDFGSASGGNSARLIKTNIAQTARVNQLVADKPASH